MESEQISVTVLLPDMFQTFLKQEALVNPHYEKVKMESEEWLSDFCSFEPKMRKKINKCDFSYFCAIAAPFAPRSKFRTICDWGNWVFPYDDMFDNGCLRDKPEESQRVMESLMMPMMKKSSHLDTKERLRIVQAHDTVFQRIAAEAPTGVQRRFALAMQGYCQGALIQIDNQFASKTPSLEEVVLIRQRSAGCKPLYHLVEYAHGLLIPDEVFDNPVIQELECLGMDMVAISNDILSYRKEQAEGVPHNMVTVCRSNGMSPQKAFNTVGKLLEQRYRRWDETEASVPSWGEKTDVQVRKYIEGIKCVVKANLNWSFKSERYLGSNPAHVRVTRVLRILAETPVSQERMVAVKKHHSTLQYDTLKIIRSLIIWLFHLI
ncbi:terpene synthase [Trichoderma atroviride IMI 206040]|uniref:Terpene synthase n=1 Tax=Hypocrea atroviridis (strain ATCC 20476 / IMI 206040) TaxID=452589 RepID=G9P1I4_HYPAI|nr:terpene synthase [Trichoderma atroviride IMI 206040]EHK42537.1 terpene synthase [Trichoderma atroviride IMI 206040]